MRCIRVGVMTVLLLALVWPAAAQQSDDLPGNVRGAVVQLEQAGKAVTRTYTPLRRGASEDPESWRALSDLYIAVGKLATSAGRLQEHVEVLKTRERERLVVPGWEYRRRAARADSLIVLVRELAVQTWDGGLPSDAVEARRVVTQRAQRAKELADRMLLATVDLAYAVGVTEGVGRRSLSLSLVGIAVVFSVLALMSLVVGGVRKLDDGWQVKEVASAAAAFEKEPTIDATTLVLISAACTTVIAGRFRVRRIRRLLSPRAKRTPWSAQGRLILQGSHSVDRKQN